MIDPRKVNQKAGPMGDRRTKRQRDRSTVERLAVEDYDEDDNEET